MFGITAIILTIGLPAAQEAKTGDYRTSFTERSPHSALEEMSRRLPRLKGPDYTLKDESYCVSVPASYGADRPHGLLVFINSAPDGECYPQIKGLLEKHRLIWIAANASGNDRLTAARVGLALDAVFHMKKLYSIDPDRIYASGISGGGRVCSFLAPAYPDVFNGAMYLIGCNSLAAKLQPELQDRMKNNGYVFLTGDNDFNLPGTKRVYDEYQRAHVARTTYLQVPGMGHEVPPAEWIDKGLTFLDEPLVAGAKALHAQALALQKRDKPGQALKAFLKVAARAPDQPFGKEALEKAVAIEKKRDEQFAAAQVLVDAGNGREAVPLLEKFLRDYEDPSGAARDLLKKARR
jgi:predicted esterase